ncbi:MAG TPA: DNA polymerase III subunit gamma and tau [Dermatophilaceae bacterium]|nr:DNA polymerase III subunit gamma and tau [Dermatophilaceae bacterium]
MTTALYRRYRPETFADVIGQEHVTEPIMQALRTGRVGHAYLFSGPRGCGKTTSARILARCLNCEQGPTPTPCGTCDSCVALARGGPGSVDVIEIDAASHGGVDDARDLRERAAYGPAQSRYKVYIIDEAHMVTPQGFNALLKIVEEPPEHVKFVFATTEPEKVIGTIRSRTHHYPFRLVPPAKLTDYLERLCESEQVAVAPGVLGFVTRAGGGSVRDSLSVLDQLIAGSGQDGLTYPGAAALLGFTSVELLDATVDALAAGDAAGVFGQVDKVIESGHDPRRFALDLLERLRDLIIVAAVPDGAAQVLRGVPEDQLDRMRGQQSRFGPGALSRAADIVNAGVTEMTGATSPRLQLELICARILLPAASGESGYAARLDRLERRLEVGGVPAAGSGERAAGERAALGRAAAGPVASVAPVRATPDSRAEVTAGGTSERPGEARGETRGAERPEAGAGGGAAARGPVAAGGIDTAAIRRVWPEVLGRIFGMRRATWTFLSTHAQVLDYDGQRLVLGIATTGLANTFRQGTHAEVVRQALIDEIGLDVRVEGIPAPAGGGATSSGPLPAAPAASGAAPAVTPDAAPGAATPAATTTGLAPGAAVPSPAAGAVVPARTAPDAPRAQPAQPTAPPPSSPAAPGPAARPDWDDEPPPDEPPPDDEPMAKERTPFDLDPPPPPPGLVESVRAAARAARPAAGSTGPGRRSGPPAPASGPAEASGRHTGASAADIDSDDEASLDDEDVEGGDEMGQAVIERMLGGRVLGETGAP